MMRSALSTTHFCARRRMRARPSKPSASQPGCAARARATMAATSSGCVAGIVRTICPVAGFSTGMVCVPSLLEVAVGSWSTVAMRLSLLSDTGVSVQVQERTAPLPERPDCASMRRRRAAAQLLVRPSDRPGAGGVRHLLAVQAQDPRSARLALRARCTGLEPAGDVVVTWLVRGTLHLVHADDL